jgi:trehalose 6-phosphate synthase
MGFFLHVPFPSFDVLRTLPCHEQILRELASYDVVGFQTRRDLWAFQDCLRQPEIGGRLLGGDRVEAYGRQFTADSFPISIDVEQCRTLAAGHGDNPQVRRLVDDLGDRQLIIGVDRLDYSKGLDIRFRAIESLFANYPSTRRQTIFMQIAPPTRTGVRAYEEIRHELEQAAGNINGRYAEMDWVPIRCLNKGYDRGIIMTMLRVAKVGLVTSVRDGMNLVAKEYVASQDPEDPGVLVLSRLCGAAEELGDAVLVNPYDIDGVADGIQTALEMPLAERRARYERMIATLGQNDIHSWCERFLKALQDARHE